MHSDIVIIGSGHSGGMAAITLRQKKFKGSITVIGKESYPPYQRPPLSKNFLVGEIEKERIFLKTEAFYRKNNINLTLNKTVKAILKDKKELILENEQILSYKFLIIATGSSLIKLKTKSLNNNIKYLRNIEDCEHIKLLMKESKTIGIIGSGYIGLEIAAAAIKSKLDVTVIEKEKNVMSRVVGEEVSDFLNNLHQKKGVKFLFNNIPLNIEEKNNYQEITLEKNLILKKDIVIAGIGVIPNIELAERSGITCNNGIKVDLNCCTSDDNIFAIGDCVSQYNNLYNKYMRLESVQNAVDQAKIVANFLVGGTKQYNPIPWFWSDQYEIKLQIAGISENYDNKIIKGSMKDKKFTIFYLRDNKIISLEAINSPKDFMLGKKFIEKKIPADSYEIKNFLMI